ncbi:hypothetical protein [Nodularia sphaerocarpa]|uniref:hypothetical protein n=1 Tax=Nodularia sphaerocarpa TaxID=137816 RepID=UPI001EFADB14|nr:hypothetical protein [Nodularia sphaerocarpa]MDB9375749.1 hypothetical protein [Nodularia sphaerocarpa CS-585]MDB9377237.1 hypothetical protein [Nodularia sphaerocarpa CS-585A2]
MKDESSKLAILARDVENLRSESSEKYLLFLRQSGTSKGQYTAEIILKGDNFTLILKECDRASFFFAYIEKKLSNVKALGKP